MPEIAKKPAWGRIILDRSSGYKLNKSDGLILTIQMEPDVEEFMKSLGSGKPLLIDSILGSPGMWKNKQKGEPLLVYDYAKKTNNFNLKSVGTALQTPGQKDGNGGYTKESLNISFMRLVGISQPGGVSIIVQEPFGFDDVLTLGNRLKAEVYNFLREYVAPIRITIEFAGK